MPNPNPVPGRCNAKRRDGTFCANKPHFPPHELGPDGKHRGNGRCKHHGALSTGPISPSGQQATGKNNLKHGAYSTLLRNLLPEAEQKVFDDPASRVTDLSHEIALARARVTRFQMMLAEGKKFITKQSSHGAQSESYAVWYVEELLERALTQLSNLTARQHDMHPEAGLHGNLKVKVSLQVDAQTRAALDAKYETPDLDAEGSVPSADVPAEEAQVPDDKPTSPLAQFEDP